ncbi:hypothetical protein TNCV_4058231 [Trichonephila clavipes]|nr:hypothetical protein TNCV_4058231 [Trichonephila clavipes]
MFESSSYVNPTPLAHADTSRDVLPRGGTSQGELVSSQTHACDAFWFQYDNARPPTARIVDVYLEQEAIQRMQWPA